VCRDERSANRRLRRGDGASYDVARLELALLAHSTDSRTERRVIHAVLGVVLVASFILKLQHLSHGALRGLDESFHAVVAANLLKHPLTPTLIDRPFLPGNYDAWKDDPTWLHSHVWLHKPPMAMWQIAISFLFGGVNALALRMPSALLSTGAVWLTYAIGAQVIDRRAGLIAATLQAVNPAMLMLVHGYAFSDHVDISLLFWTELGIWLGLLPLPLGEGRGEGLSFQPLTPALSQRERGHASRVLALAGVAQGLAFLSKTYPALIVTLIAIAATVLKLMTWRQFLILIAATVMTVAPWNIYAAILWPHEFVQANLLILSHLHENVESFAGPWDRVWFAYLLNAHYVFYTSTLTAAILLIPIAWRQRREKRRLWLLYVWMLGVLVPFTLATSKTPSATLLAWPAMFLLLGALISRATRGDIAAAAAWLVATSLAVFATGDIPKQSFGADVTALTAFHDASWVLWHVLLATAIGLMLLPLAHRFRTPTIAMTVLAAAGACWLLCETTAQAWKVTNLNVEHPSYARIGEFVRSRLPPNAVLLCEEKEKLERNTLMFRAGRTAYPLGPDPARWHEIANDVLAAGGEPYVVSYRELLLDRLAVDREDQRVLYRLSQ
jgi:4-amino-4-deoxy-L-arabinose transferase